MSIRTTEDPSGVTVYLTGEIDLDRSPDVRKALVAAVGKRRPLVVDMAEVSYMDSSGIACLVLAFQQSSLAKQDFSLVRVGDRVRKILELARLDKVFRIR